VYQARIHGRPETLQKVLLDGGRARPWLGPRMPQFGKDNVGFLVQGLATLEGALPDDGVHQVALNAEKLAAGKHLAGKTGFACNACHDVGGTAGTVTRGVDLVGMHERLRYDWYRRWLQQPQRMHPGTRMPSVFPDGGSTLPGILDGNADAQAEALWRYFLTLRK